MKIRYDSRIITKTEMKEINHTRYVNTIIRYFNSLRDVDSITPMQFHVIVQMMKKFPKLFGCVYGTFGYDEISELLEPVVRLYYDLTRYELYDDEKSPSEKTFIKICRLYGIEVD